MKTILVPSDFSKFSENALDLAIAFAQSLGAKIILCHVVQVPSTMGEISFTVLAKEKANLKKKAEAQIKALSLKIEKAGVLSETKVLDGEIVSGLLDCINAHGVGLVIMGTRGVKNIQDQLLGSTTEQMIQKSKCPVMAVPEDIHLNKTIKHLAFATDYNKSDIIDILQLIGIAEKLKAQVNVLHVSGDEISAEQEVKLMSDFMKKISEKSAYNNLSFQILHGNRVSEKLLEYLKEESTDVLVMATHHRSLIERLFSKSQTLSLLNASKTPVIAFHCS